MTTTDAPVTTTAHAAAPAPSARPRRRLSPGRLAAWAVMIVILLITVFPFYWMLRTALSSNTALATNPSSLLPVGFSLGGFARVFGLQDVDTAVSQGGSGASITFWQYLLNTVVVATSITVVQTFSCAMAAYAFSRLRWRGRETVFLVFLAAMMIPQIFTLLPNFVLIKNLHLVDTLLGIMLPSLFISPFAIFFLRQFFNNISREVEEAALIDGASKVRVFFTLILPMSSAPLATLGLLTYMTAWNEYFWSLMVSYSDSSRVLTVALAVFRAQSPNTGTDWAGLMAATLVAALPMLILFALFAKRIVNSIGFSGIK
ncbi:carbohydrate ABC transporter permease [Brachybacterium rhamnosum]|uniref:Carbohydrate ABC transporter permease n=1 Tax=Brachybacterium rhamnosum TaxID=173361 RepID=A0ABW4Q4N8_9MICO|nr:carbohydrate ABC transporter permease [Brachybacterium sp. SGAir0954]QCR54775.1 sugar ABC transporter permease [Brachybacterium sp. SGAir0954]